MWSTMARLVLLEQIHDRLYPVALPWEDLWPPKHTSHTQSWMTIPISCSQSFWWDQDDRHSLWNSFVNGRYDKNWRSLAECFILFGPSILSYWKNRQYVLVHEFSKCYQVIVIESWNILEHFCHQLFGHLQFQCGLYVRLRERLPQCWYAIYASSAVQTRAVILCSSLALVKTQQNALLSWWGSTLG